MSSGLSSRYILLMFLLYLNMLEQKLFPLRFGRCFLLLLLVS